MYSPSIYIVESKAQRRKSIESYETSAGFPCNLRVHHLLNFTICQDNNHRCQIQNLTAELDPSHTKLLSVRRKKNHFVAGRQKDDDESFH